MGFSDLTNIDLTAVLNSMLWQACTGVVLDSKASRFAQENDALRKIPPPFLGLSFLGMIV
jgi:hypothetical protein